MFTLREQIYFMINLNSLSYLVFTSPFHFSSEMAKRAAMGSPSSERAE